LGVNLVRIYQTPTIKVNKKSLKSEIKLAIHSIFVNDFLNTYQTLSKFQKKVFAYLQWFSKKFKCVFPCLFKIANAVGCSIATVKRATAIFQDLGWIYKKKRGYQSNLYFLNDELIYLNLNDVSIFLREECAVNEPVLRSSSIESIVNGTKEVKGVPISREIPHMIKPAKISDRDKQRLANEFSDYELTEAVQDTKQYLRWGNKITSLIAVLWSAAKRARKKL